MMLRVFNLEVQECSGEPRTGRNRWVGARAGERPPTGSSRRLLLKERGSCAEVDFVRRFPAEPFARPMIELCLRPQHVATGEAQEVRAFWEVLTQQAVGILMVPRSHA